ncbi:MAG: hypothetical protein PUP92_31910 [Rhizonema sp. PD38]|nr:hypothetical protein [Rhizonema sp. PD38]
MYYCTESNLNIKSITQLKDVYVQLGSTKTITDKRVKANWVEAILTSQSAQIEKVSAASVKVEEQVAPQSEEIKTVEINFYEHEVYKGNKQIASITHDSNDFQTQRWVVMVDETEVHRANSWAKCHSYITWHHKQGTLPVYEKSVAQPTQEFVETKPVEVIPKEVVSPVFTITSNWNINLTPNSEIAICPDCDGVGCARCRYSGGLSIDLCVPTTSYRMTYFSQIKNSVAYIAYNAKTPLGMLFRVRNLEEFWENEATSYYWQCGGSEKYWSLGEAFTALKELTAPKTDDELLDTPFDELTREEWERLKANKKQLQNQLEKSFINDNFGCYNRAGASTRGVDKCVVGIANI